MTIFLKYGIIASMKDKKLQNYYDNRFSMMNQQGWKDLLEDLKNMLNRYSNINNIKTMEDFYVAKGQVDILKYIMDLKETTTSVYNSLIAQEKEFDNKQKQVYTNT